LLDCEAWHWISWGSYTCQSPFIYVSSLASSNLPSSIFWCQESLFKLSHISYLDRSNSWSINIDLRQLKLYLRVSYLYPSSQLTISQDSIPQWHAFALIQLPSNKKTVCYILFSAFEFPIQHLSSFRAFLSISTKCPAWNKHSLFINYWKDKSKLLLPRLIKSKWEYNSIIPSPQALS